MSAWATIICTLIALAGTIVVNLIATSWYLGRRMERYDAFGKRIDTCEEADDLLVELARETARDVLWLKAEIRKLGGTAPNGGH